MNRIVILALLAGAALQAACSKGPTPANAGPGEVSRSWNPTAVTSVQGVPINQLKPELEKAIATKPAGLDDDQWKHTKQLYAAYKTSPLWLDDDGLIRDRANALVDALMNATGDGMDIGRYPLNELAQSLNALRQTKQPTAQQLAHADALLTAAYVGLAEDYLTGQIDPASVAQSWHIDPQEERVDSALARSIREKSMTDAITRMRPADDDYKFLLQRLADYRKIVKSGGWQMIPAGKAVKRGQTDSPARLAALRARLRAEGFETDSAAPGVFDASLAAAVAKFQEHHTIHVDSALGAETVNALNVSADFRLAQIAANLERFRWLPRRLGARYIMVNVPAFRLEAYDSGQKSLEMKVIVGAEYEGRATPVFSDQMEVVVFRPYWNVTPDIAAKEFFPKYGDNLPEGFETYTENGALRIRQRPGPKNALGLVKFLFPNDFNIYLHDTPQDELFKKDVRAFSHGCIRLEKPDALAQWVLGWPADKVRNAMENGPDNRTIKLPVKLPVYITYFTTFSRDGELWFGNDLYMRDDALVKAVAQGAMPTAETLREVGALRDLTK